MTDAIQYEMTQKQLDAILEACRPVPYLVVGGVPPISPQQSANIVWNALGREMGFDGLTVKPVAGKGERFFTAVPAIAARRDQEEDHQKPDSCPRCGEPQEPSPSEEAECEVCGWVIGRTKP